MTARNSNNTRFITFIHDHAFYSAHIEQYDLRAVLVHTGFPGRKQIYSYVQDIEGVWWKTVDHEVTGVSLQVLAFAKFLMAFRYPRKLF
jgi:hypothetical protein